MLNQTVGNPDKSCRRKGAVLQYRRADFIVNYRLCRKMTKKAGGTLRGGKIDYNVGVR